MLQALPHLRVLQLSSVANFSDEDARLIVLHCCKLQFLKLSRLRIRTFGITAPQRGVLDSLSKLKLVDLAQLDANALATLSLRNLRHLVLDGNMNVAPYWNWAVHEHPGLSTFAVCLTFCDVRRHATLVEELATLRNLRSLTLRYAYFFKYPAYFSLFAKLSVCNSLRFLCFKAHPNENFAVSETSIRTQLFACLPNVRVSFAYDT